MREQIANAICFFNVDFAYVLSEARSEYILFYLGANKMLKVMIRGACKEARD